MTDAKEQMMTMSVAAEQFTHDPPQLPELSFGQWLCGQVERNDDVGDLARGYLEAVASGDVILRDNNPTLLAWISSLADGYAGEVWGTAADKAAWEYSVRAAPQWRAGLAGCIAAAGEHGCALMAGHPEPHFCDREHIDGLPFWGS